MSDERFSNEAPTTPYSVGLPAPRTLERRAEERVRIVTEVSLSSDSQFFSGLSGDVSSGGLFVATYQQLEVGREVALHFALPEGEIVAEGTVKWVRAQSEGTVPGVGIAFRALAAEDGDRIVRFCAARPPLYCDVGDRESMSG